MSDAMGFAPADVAAIAGMNTAERRLQTQRELYAKPPDHTVVPITKLPYRLENFGEGGWTVNEFTPAGAAEFFARYEYTSVAMPCWRRMHVRDGVLLVRGR